MTFIYEQNASRAKTWVVGLRGSPGLDSDGWSKVRALAVAGDILLGCHLSSQSIIVSVRSPETRQNAVLKIESILKKAGGNPAAVESVVQLDLFHAEQWGWLPVYSKPPMPAEDAEADTAVAQSIQALAQISNVGVLEQTVELEEPEAMYTPSILEEKAKRMQDEYVPTPKAVGVAWLSTEPLALAIYRPTRDERKLQWLLFRAEKCNMELEMRATSFPLFLVLYKDLHAHDSASNLLKYAKSLWRKWTGEELPPQRQLPKELSDRITQITYGRDEDYCAKCQQPLLSSKPWGKVCSEWCHRTTCHKCGLKKTREEDFSLDSRAYAEWHEINEQLVHYDVMDTLAPYEQKAKELALTWPTGEGARQPPTVLDLFVEDKGLCCRFTGMTGSQIVDGRCRKWCGPCDRVLRQFCHPALNKMRRMVKGGTTRTALKTRRQLCLKYKPSRLVCCPCREKRLADGSKRRPLATCGLWFHL